MSRSNQLFCMLFAALATVLALPGWAQSQSADEWQFSAAPYIWLINVEGDITVKGNKAEVDTNLFEIIDQSDSIFAFEGRFEASKGNLGGFLDLTYVAIGMDVGVGPVDADIDATVTLLEFGGFYRVAESSLDARSAGTNTRNVAFYLLAGGRYTSLNVDMDLSVGPAAGSFGESKDWVDPFVGGRAIVDLTDRVVLVVRGDIGGFGVGSDFTWHTLGMLGYRFELFGAEATALAGYRALYQDYDSGSGANEFRWDLTIHGPIFALNFNF